MLLCDHADAINGKFYINGGGWGAILTLPGQPVSFSLAVQLAVPWTATNKRHHLLISLQDQDGHAVMNQGGDEIKIEGEFEVGRPPGLAAGADQRNTLAFRFDGLPLGPGQYSFRLDVDGSEITKVLFDVAPIPAGMIPQ